LHPELLWTKSLKRALALTVYNVTLETAALTTYHYQFIRKKKNYLPVGTSTLA
jgi:hypothetical protein